MDINRNGQTVTFRENEHGDLEDDAFDMHTAAQRTQTRHVNQYTWTMPNGRTATTSQAGIRDEMERHGMRYSELAAHITDLDAGHTLTANDGVTFQRTVPATPATHHPGRCYCGRFAPGHAPGLVGRAAYDNSCAGDTSKPHDAATCPACLAGATDFQAR